MPVNLFTAVTIRRRCAAHVCANAHPDAHSAGDGRDDLVDIGDRVVSEVYRALRS